MSHFLSRIPSKIDTNTRCIIMLHGVGSNEQDLFGLVSYFPPNYLIFSLRGPFVLAGGRYAWFPVDFTTGRPVYKIEDVEKGYIEIYSFLQKITEEYHLSSSQIFLLGFSQGAVLSYYTLWKSPELLGGIIGLSGRLLKEIDTSAIDTDLYAEKKVFIGHGLQDTVLSYSETKLTTGFVDKIGLVPTFKSYDAGHTITREEITDIVAWFTTF